MTSMNAKTKFPVIEKGSHLTVYTFEDGSKKLEWDDEALMRDVRAAIASLENPKAESSSAKKVKPRRKK